MYALTNPSFPSPSHTTGTKSTIHNLLALVACLFDLDVWVLSSVFLTSRGSCRVCHVCGSCFQVVVPSRDNNWRTRVWFCRCHELVSFHALFAVVRCDMIGGINRSWTRWCASRPSRLEMPCFTTQVRAKGVSEKVEEAG